ncbi:MAG: flagellar assembly protein FliX [Rhizobiales bacterium]|nr:flagellar assembly protein FliX [Hyphomicrobiales bacterium]MBO6697741.1 flagellar assembly protein FliX [Hyphomicrobiales bacterium]MBO6736004.1 flagellar assembly protein FliX [Hyphomicrobiales bacterium]MBO6912474.1 flagellar assembly protein FliX [Hyphomicrobiales bacterium]MBO6955105.1 flagellar assembly protein FliX [Hyphomicrobiales bacterium]
MRVEGPKSSASVGKSRKSGEAARGFVVPSQGSSATSSAASSSAGIAGVQSLDAILALQSVDNAEDRERRAVRHGHDLLDQLEALRADLLAGQISPQRVGALLSLIRAKQAAEDPKLAALIDDIALRARVELAKLGIDA